jgi:hypothetical protein
MNTETKKLVKPLSDEEFHTSEQPEREDESLVITVEYSSLKDMPLEERRKQAKEPLYLIRYE